MINWDAIFWSCITFGVLLGICIIVYYIFSARMIKGKRNELVETHEQMKVGKNILFSGGIKGKIVKVSKDYLDVEIAKDTVITISRYAVLEVEK